MNVYQTNIDGVFVGITTADPDPLDENNMLIPAGCVEIEPPATKEGQFARWYGSAWAVEDVLAPESAPKPEPVDPTVSARDQRNSLLAASDWTMIPDVPVDQVAWATYRQGLRDIPQQAGFPNNITWPVEPEEVL